MSSRSKPPSSRQLSLLPAPAPKRLRYFAYGSNVDRDQMRARCPSARLLDTAVLHDHALVFAGHSLARAGAVATVVACRGIDVPGALYSISASDLVELDRCEGVPWFYRRTTARVLRSEARRIRAAIYALRPAHLVLGMPAPEYVAQITAAYRRLKLPMTALEIAKTVAAQRRPLLGKRAVDFDDTGPNVPVRPNRPIDPENDCE